MMNKEKKRENKHLEESTIEREWKEGRRRRE
jgi:hypothetical protein